VHHSLSSSVSLSSGLCRWLNVQLAKLLVENVPKLARSKSGVQTLGMLLQAEPADEYDAVNPKE
jgi:hypothetical protein